MVLMIKEFALDSTSNIIKGELSFAQRETLIGAGYGDTYVLPDSCGKMNSFRLLLSAIGTGDSGAIELSISSKAAVLSGQGIFFVWDTGTVTGHTNTEVIAPVTAIRQVNYSGTTIMEVFVS